MSAAKRWHHSMAVHPHPLNVEEIPAAMRGGFVEGFAAKRTRIR
jgi:hypothetical protein